MVHTGVFTWPCIYEMSTQSCIVWACGHVCVCVCVSVCVAHSVMIVVEKLLFSKIENKVELLPLSKHWTFLSCEEKERERGEKGSKAKRKGREGE